jgi:outer membrane protein TolC
MRSCLVVLALSAAFSLPPGQARALEAGDGAEVITLVSAVRLALENSPVLKSSSERITQANAQIRMAYGMLLPFVRAQGSYSRADEEIKFNMGGFSDLAVLAMANCATWDEATMGPRPGLCDQAQNSDSSSSSSSARVIQELNNFDASLTVGMSLLNARTFPLIKNVYTGKEIAILAADFTAEQLAFAVAQLYFGAATAQNATGILTENLATAQRHKELTEIRVKNGVALQNERVRADMSVVQATSSLEQARLALDLVLRSLALLMGRQPDETFRVEDAPATPWQGVEGVVLPADELGRRKDLLMLDKSALIAERSVTDVWMKFVPTMAGAWTFSASSNKGFADRYTQWRAIISLNWSLFEGGTRLAEIDEAKARVRAARYDRDAALLRAQTELEQARSSILTARVDLKTAADIRRLAEENLALVEVQYKAGVAPQTTLIDAQSQQIAARFGELRASLQLGLAEVSFARAAGRLDSREFR